LTVDFVVCTLAVKKKNQGRFRHVGSDHSLVISHNIGTNGRTVLNVVMELGVP
jgi:hypothetical protein